MTLLHLQILQENITKLFKLVLIKKINLTALQKEKKKSQKKPIRDMCSKNSSFRKKMETFQENVHVRVLFSKITSQKIAAFTKIRTHNIFFAQPEAVVPMCSYNFRKICKKTPVSEFLFLKSCSCEFSKNFKSTFFLQKTSGGCFYHQPVS